MEFTNETLLKMNDKRALFNKKFSEWYLQYYYEIGGNYKVDDYSGLKIPCDDVPKTFFLQSERVGSCLDFWLWDKYEKNKILDLKTVNRCMNTRFCPNCKTLDIMRFVHKFRSIFNEYIEQGYKFYMLTLSIPNCELTGGDLKLTIEKLSKAFAKLFTKFGYEDGKALKDRLISIFGGIRVLEVTCNEFTGFHPHFHCIVLLRDEPDAVLLEKNIEGKWSSKRKKYNMHSLIDLQIAKIWGMIWYGHKMTKNNLKNYVVRPKEVFVDYYEEKIEDKVLQVDFRPLDEEGLKEVFKYTFKSTEVETFDIFKGLVDGLAYKRIRQGFGVLYNAKVNDDELEDGEKQQLVLEVPEDPVQLATNEIIDLINDYRDYKKISRFNPEFDESIVLED